MLRSSTLITTRGGESKSTKVCKLVFAAALRSLFLVGLKLNVVGLAVAVSRLLWAPRVSNSWQVLTCELSVAGSEGHDLFGLLLKVGMKENSCLVTHELTLWRFMMPRSDSVSGISRLSWSAAALLANSLSSFCSKKSFQSLSML